MNPAPMPIVVGSPRSGTTLLRLMIDAHPDVAIPPETGFLMLGTALVAGERSPRENFFEHVTEHPPEAPGWVDFRLDADSFRRELDALEPFDLSNGLRTFYRLYAARCAKTRWGDKTPLYGRHLRSIEAILPEAHFIHLVRDGRDAALSLRERWFSPGPDMATQAAFWRDNVLTTRTQGHLCRHYVELHFEDLVRQPEVEMRRICEFLALDFAPSMLRHHERSAGRLAEHGERRRRNGELIISAEDRAHQQRHSALAPDARRIGLWRQGFNAEEAATFRAIAGSALAAFGYPLD